MNLVRAYPALFFLSAWISANAGVVQRRRRCCLGAKYVENQQTLQRRRWWSGLQNRELQVRVLPGL
jgi:hypothetical protein